MTPTQRSLALLRKEGYDAQVVEKWIPGANIRKDLWEFIDIVGVAEDGSLVFVQVTTASNLSARIKKAKQVDAYQALARGGHRIEFHGWKKEPQGKRARYVLRRETVNGGSPR